tara:strand:- start:124 stop:612 length:489 start_codon:yes stop_codon:yes gene_type:complete
MDNKEEVLCSSIQHNFHKAWCDLLREKIIAKDWQMFELCLGEIVNRLKGFIPNRTDMHTQLDREIPVSLIIQMLRNDAVIPEDFLQYFGSIMQWLKKLGPPVLDDTVNSMIKDLEKVAADKYIETMPDTLLAINLHLDTVQMQIDKFKDELISSTSNGDDTK